MKELISKFTKIELKFQVNKCKVNINSNNKPSSREKEKICFFKEISQARIS